MNDVTGIIKAIEDGDPTAADRLLPLVYDELRSLARKRLRHEGPDLTLQATALVHEAYIRLLGKDLPVHWNSRAHFFGAAAEAMRRILIEDARRKSAQKHGAGVERVELGDELAVDSSTHPERLIELSDIIDKLHASDPQKAELVKLKLFIGLSVEDAGGVLGISTAKAYRLWNYCRAWLKAELT